VRLIARILFHAMALDATARRLAHIQRGLERGRRKDGLILVQAAAVESGAPPLVAHWPLDELVDGPSPTGRPVVLDVAGGCHGSVIGALPAFGARQLRRGALQFVSAKGDHVSIPYSPRFNLNSFTVAAWVRLSERSSPSGPHDVLGGVLGTRCTPGGSGNSCCFDLKVNGANQKDGAKCHGDIGDGDAWISTVDALATDTGSNNQGGELKLGRWYHLCWAVDSDLRETRMYIDGDRK